MPGLRHARGRHATGGIGDGIDHRGASAGADRLGSGAGGSANVRIQPNHIERRTHRATAAGRPGGRGGAGRRAGPGGATARARGAAQPRHHPGRRRRRQRRVHPDQAEAGRRAGLRLAARTPAGRRRPGRPAPGDHRVQRRQGRTRPAHPVPDPGAPGLRRRAGGDGPRHGRRRHAPGEHGPAGARHARPAAVHAGRDRGAACLPRDPGGRAGGGHPGPGRRHWAGRWRCCWRRSGRPPTRR